MAESHSDPGAAAAQEEAEESPDVGSGSVLAARQVTSLYHSPEEMLRFTDTH